MSESSSPKKYWAFISYSSKDKKWGSWLHRRLENYPIPKEFREIEIFDGGTLKKNLRPCFRDRDELAGSTKLGPAILAALKESRYLVVLCSKNSAQSEWVNKEIEDFKELHGDKNILALILDGEPNASSNESLLDSQECFPPALRYPHEPLAGDLRKEGDGKERGFLKILAGVSQIGFDDLYRRHERAKKRTFVTYAVMALTIITILSGLSAFAFNQQKIAEENEIEAVKQTQVATRKKLAMSLNYASELIQNNRISEARKTLLNNRPVERNWAWEFLLTRCGFTPKLITELIKPSIFHKPELHNELVIRFSENQVYTRTEGYDFASETMIEQFEKKLKENYRSWISTYNGGRPGCHTTVWGGSPPIVLYSSYYGMYSRGIISHDGIASGGLVQDKSCFIDDMTEVEVNTDEGLRRSANLSTGDLVLGGMIISPLPNLFADPEESLDELTTGYMGIVPPLDTPSPYTSENYVKYGPVSLGGIDDNHRGYTVEFIDHYIRFYRGIGYERENSESGLRERWLDISSVPYSNTENKGRSYLENLHEKYNDDMKSLRKSRPKNFSSDSYYTTVNSPNNSYKIEYEYHRNYQSYKLFDDKGWRAPVL